MFKIIKLQVIIAIMLFKRPISLYNFRAYNRLSTVLNLSTQSIYKMDVFLPNDAQGTRSHGLACQWLEQGRFRAENIDEQIDLYFFPDSQVIDHIAFPTIDAEPNCTQIESIPVAPGRLLRQRKPVPLNKSVNLLNFSEKRSSRGKKHKLSPYHNYQKHLNLAVRHLIMMPALTADSPMYEVIAHDLWKVFMQSENCAKKVLHFVFNETNEYQICHEDLEQLRFDAIYDKYQGQQIARAKNYLTHLALEQLTDQNINHYLQSRRIKDPVQFKKYLHVFYHELEEGFIKKRFTNHYHKWEVRSLFEDKTTPSHQ